MYDAIMGTVILFAGKFAPKGWAFCNGQLLSVQQNSALFSLLGAIYGGDGVNTFALPDLRGRTPISAGQGAGLDNYELGEAGGQEQVTLTAATLPAHSHSARTTMAVEPNPGNNSSPAGNYLAISSAGNPYADELTVEAELAPGALTTTVAPTGGNQPHNNRSPYLALNYIIALVGIYPSQDD
ncbi:phage tail protein [Hymenobacter sp. IS2118]|uniref:phage tail protein n=1 Tax=Hymenobacter sp. IS2118 TaxID=1505605 RepID=UPI0005521F8B|nr:tail fiber protein [Hymenobacter sp. IS2118]